MATGHPVERPDQGGHVLAGLQGPHEHEHGTAPPAVDQPVVHAGQHGDVGSLGPLVRPEPPGVHAVVGHEYLGSTPCTTARARPPWPGSGTPRRRPGAATLMARRKNSAFERSCHCGSSKKLRSWTVTTDGTRDRSGIV